MRARLLLLAAALAAFGASLGSGFHFDDYAIFDPVHPYPAALVGPWRADPAAHLSDFLAELPGRRRRPLGYHAVNLVLHLGAVLLATSACGGCCPSAPRWSAAAIFAVHPLQAEAVDYVWGAQHRAGGAAVPGLLCVDRGPPLDGGGLVRGGAAGQGGSGGVSAGAGSAAGGQIEAEPGGANRPHARLLAGRRLAHGLRHDGHAGTAGRPLRRNLADEVFSGGRRRHFAVPAAADRCRTDSRSIPTFAFPRSGWAGRHGRRWPRWRCWRGDIPAGRWRG